jgi:hypothetical protein
MAWDTIQSSEVDANSPLNQTLFDKIRQNLNYLAEGLICFSGDDPVESQLIPGDGTWTDVDNKAGKIFVPSFVDSLEVQIESKFVDTGLPERGVRVAVSDGSEGWNYSEAGIPGNGSYTFSLLTCPESGSFSGPGEWRSYKVQVKQQEWNPHKAWVRNIAFKVKSIN